MNVPGQRRPRAPELRIVYRPESAVYWVFVGALIFGSVELLFRFGSRIDDTLAMQATLVPVWILFVVCLVWLILRFDPYRSTRGYPQILIAALALGATMPLYLAVAGDTAVKTAAEALFSSDTVEQWSAALTAPILEEAAKAMCAAVILVLCAEASNRISHALIVGMFVGLGFDIVEDFVYVTVAAIDNLDSDLQGAVPSLVLRMATAVPSHWAFTSLTAVGVLLLLPSFTSNTRWRWERRITTAIALFLSAWLMHFVWNAPTPSDANAAFAVLAAKLAFNLTLFLTIARLLLRNERNWIQDSLNRQRRDPHGPLAAIPDEILDSLPTRKQRRSLQKSAQRSGGRPARHATKRLQHTALETLQNQILPDSGNETALSS